MNLYSLFLLYAFFRLLIFITLIHLLFFITKILLIHCHLKLVLASQKASVSPRLFFVNLFRASWLWSVDFWFLHLKFINHFSLFLIHLITNYLFLVYQYQSIQYLRPLSKSFSFYFCILLKINSFQGLIIVDILIRKIISASRFLH